MHRLLTLFAIIMTLMMPLSAAYDGTRDNSVMISRVPTIDRLPSRCILTIFQDKEGEMWYGTEDGLCRDNGHSIKIYYPVKVPGVSPDNNKITSVTADGLGRIWFGTPKGAFIIDKQTQLITPVDDQAITSAEVVSLDATSDGDVWLSTDGKLYRFSAEGKLKEEYPLTWNNLPTRVNDLFEDSRGRIWMTLAAGGICSLDQEKGMWNYYPWPFKESAMRMAEDRSGKFFWVGTWLRGIVKFSPDETSTDKMFVEMQTVKSKDERDYAMLYIVQDDHDGYLWTTTVNGLKVFSLDENGKLRQIDGIIPEPSRYQMLTEIIKDRDGNLWVGGYNVPSFIISFRPGIKTLNLDAIQHESGHVATISQTCVDDDPDKLWVFQERHRLYLYDMTTNKLQSEVGSAFANTNNNVGSIYLMRKSNSRQGVWACCMYPNSIYRIFQTNGKIDVSDHIDFSTKLPPRAIFEDSGGALWIGTEQNLYIYHPETRQLVTAASGIGKVVDIKPCINNGVVVASCNVDGHSTVTWFQNRRKNGSREFALECTALAITNDSTLWLGTRTGELYRAPRLENPEPVSSFTDYIPLGYIAGLFVDRNNHLWVQSEQRITEISPETTTLKYYYVNDNRIGLFNFFPRSYAIHRSGKIIFGGTGGLCVITPTTDMPDNVVSETQKPVYITGIHINGETVDIPLKGNSIEVRPSDRDIEIEFSTNDHLNAAHISYAYRLLGKGSDERWQKLAPGTNKVLLNRLPRGQYNFEARCITGDSVTDSTGDICSVLIDRKPAFYETLWFDLLLFSILAIIVVAVVIGYNRSKSQQRHKELEEELTQTKFRFFTNITHELRTPLTLIITPLDSMIRKSDDGPVRKQLIAIRKNAIELMNLINKILNFRRLEMGGEKLNLSKGDAVGFVMSIGEEFKPLAAEKQIDYSFTHQCESLYMDFDIVKLRIIVNNLLSNAFKFTSPGDSISLDISKEVSDGSEVAVIKVSDTGIGIEPSKQAHIFDRFYQADDNQGAGSGIGLHLVEEYIRMHSGMIDLKSAPGNGTTFTVRLPVINVAGTTEKETQTEEPQSVDERKKILIVEDNDEFREFMKTELSDLYAVIDACDAFEGSRLATEQHPDIIISDVMMPGRDGYEFCRLIKNDVSTSDIPVILLTARSDYSAELTAYENHADAFVQKPFNLQMLINRIENLIERRNRQHIEFQKEPETDFTKLDLTPLDRALLDKIKECIDKNLTNSEYSVAELSNDVSMSRMNLYRKLQSITGQTPSDFIKTIRLKKAAKMLLENSSTIVEIAYAVGYSSPSYFSRSFKSEFGMTPRQYLEKNRLNQ